MTTENQRSQKVEPLSEESAEIKRYITVDAPTLDIADIRKIVMECVDDYVPPAHGKMAHDYALSGLRKAAKKDDELNRILRSFDRRKSRIAMHRWEWDRLLRLFRFQITTENRVWLGIFGDPGTGKSVVSMFLMLAILATFDSYDKIHPILGFARTPSDTNDLLAAIQIRKQTVIVSYDESEEEAGEGSRKEQRALLQNARTNRVFRHSVNMCSIEKEDFGPLINSCDVLIQTIFKDMENSINWCLLYTKEFNTNNWQVEAMFGVPFDLPAELLETYTAWKHETQTQLTEGGGMLSGSKAERVADALIKYARKMGYASYSVSKLEEIVRTEKIIGGTNLVMSQQKTVAQRARRLMDGAPSKGKPPLTSYIGQVDDMRAAVLARMIERGRDPIHVKALEYYVYQHISQDEVTLILKNEHDRKVTQDTVSRWLKHGEFVAEMGYAFENVYSRYLTIQGISHVAGGGNEDSPDIVLFDKDGNPSKVLSLKCLNDKRDVTSINRKEIAKKEAALAKEHNIPLEMIYFDMWKGHLHPPQLDTGQKTFTFRRPEALK